MQAEEIKSYLKQALNLAYEGKGFCAPNPAVGAICLTQTGLIGSGFHHRAGESHAEVLAMDALPAHLVKGATLFVTLEPCNHYGKTPPCVNKIRELGIARVFYGFKDPHSIASGGADALNQAGIPCEYVPVEEIDLFYRSYVHYLKTQKPWLTFKIAMSFDGKIAGKNKERIDVSDKSCEAITMRGRRYADAILTTVNTVINDNPKLNVRTEDGVIAKPIYILDSHCRLPPNLLLYNTAKSITIFYVSTPASEKNKITLISRGVNCVAVSENKGSCHLNEVIAYLGCQGYQDVWIEAGSVLLQTMLEQNVLNDILIYHSRRILGVDFYPAFSVDFDFIQYWLIGVEVSENALFVSVGS